MTVEAMATLTATAALAVAVYAVVGAVLLAGAARSNGWCERALSRLAGPSRWLTVAIPAAATAGSLYFSEIAGFVPCELCWYQRIAMYPLVVVTFVGALRRDRGLLWTVAPIAGAGFVVAVWHWLLERVPSLAATSSCSATVPCTVPWFTEFGFVTLAFMAACGFAGTVAAVAISTRRTPR